MALESINLSHIGDVQQVNVNITDDSITTLVEEEYGQRIFVYRLVISSNLAAKFTLRSGNTNDIFSMHGGARWGHGEYSESRLPLYSTNDGEALTIQQLTQDTIDANVYIQYAYVTSINEE